MNNTLVIGDSWASAYEADTGNKNAGWPDFMEIEPNLRQGISGSTANQWASDHNGSLSRAIATPSNTVIISLMGNSRKVIF